MNDNQKLLIGFLVGAIVFTLTVLILQWPA